MLVAVVVGNFKRWTTLAVTVFVILPGVNSIINMLVSYRFV